MNARRVFGAALLLAAAGAALPQPILADRAAADYFVQRGDKALKEKKWVDASGHYRKALEEDEHHVPARVGLGEALLGSGDRQAAIEALRRAVAEADGMQPLPPAWTDPTARARRRLTEVDAAGVALSQAVDKQADVLVALAEKWIERDREVAAQALRDALKLRPKHAKGTSLFAKLGSPAAAWVSLFDGHGLGGGWGAEGDTTWKVEDGVMVGDIATGGYILDHNRRLKGDFSMRVEARVLEFHEGPSAFSVAAMKDPTKGTYLAVFLEEFGIREADGAEASAQRSVFSMRLETLPTPFNPLEWNTYEMQFRGKELHVLVNGAEEVVRERASGREEAGVALLIQSCKVAVRKVEVMQR